MTKIIGTLSSKNQTY